MTPGLRDLIEELRADRSRGASELARRALTGLAEAAGNAPAADAAGLCRTLDEAAGRLEQLRPSMAPIANLVREWRRVCGGLADGSLEQARQRAAAQATALVEASLAAVGQAAAIAAQLLGDDRTVITHSMSSTVVAVLERLAPRLRVIVTESRPPGEGRRLARRLDDLGVPVHFISDAQLGLFAARADAALVGADTLTRDGAVVNKAGTYLLALAARDCGVPFYVCCESFKRAALDVAAIHLEEHDVQELDPPSGRRIRAHNVYFDLTPARLVDAWITERGIHREFDVQT